MDAFRRVMDGQTPYKIARALGLCQKRVNAIFRGIRKNPGLAVYAAGCIELEAAAAGIAVGSSSCGAREGTRSHCGGFTLHGDQSRPPRWPACR